MANMEDEIAALQTVEDFLRYFAVPYDTQLVKVQHIALMRLFHRILQSYPEPWQREHYKRALTIAYCQLKSGHQLALASTGCGSCTDCS